MAELLGSHHHLFPQWLMLVCTSRRQNKHISKMFTGFRKLTLDDLRKAHVRTYYSYKPTCYLNVLIVMA